MNPHLRYSHAAPVSPLVWVQWRTLLGVSVGSQQSPCYSSVLASSYVSISCRLRIVSWAGFLYNFHRRSLLSRAFFF